MARYRVDGLVIETPAEILELTRADGERADWTVEFSPSLPPDDDPTVEWTGDASLKGRRWARFGRDASGVRVHLHDLCDLAASCESDRATIRHREGRDRRYLLRRCTPYLVALRRRLALHAASVVLERGAIVFCGEAGTGKSTLALAFDAIGRPVLGDDHVALDVSGDAVLAHPSYPGIEVALASRTAIRPESSEPGKARVSCRTPVPARATPVAGVAFLARGDRLLVESIPPSECVPRLLREAVFVGDPGDADEHRGRLHAVARLAEAVPTYAVTVPTGLGRLTEAAADLAGQFNR